MSRKRERTAIIHDILKAIQKTGGKAKPTHVLYKSNLSSQMLKEYIAELMKKGFIEKQIGKSNSWVYVITDKGYRYVKDFRVIKNFMESYDLDE